MRLRERNAGRNGKATGNVWNFQDIKRFADFVTDRTENRIEK